MLGNWESGDDQYKPLICTERLAVRLGPTLLRAVQRNSPVLLVPTTSLLSVL